MDLSQHVYQVEQIAIGLALETVRFARIGIDRQTVMQSYFVAMAAAQLAQSAAVQKISMLQNDQADEHHDAHLVYTSLRNLGIELERSLTSLGVFAEPGHC